MQCLEGSVRLCPLKTLQEIVRGSLCTTVGLISRVVRSHSAFTTQRNFMVNGECKHLLIQWRSQGRTLGANRVWPGRKDKNSVAYGSNQGDNGEHP